MPNRRDLLVRVLPAECLGVARSHSFASASPPERDADRYSLSYPTKEVAPAMSLVPFQPQAPVWEPPWAAPTRPTRATQRYQAQMEAAAANDRRRVELAASIVRTEVDQTFDLLDLAAHRLSLSHQHITDVARGDVALEMSLRQLEALTLQIVAMRLNSFR